MIAVRPATAADLDALAALFDDYRVFYEQPTDLSRARAFVGERLDAGDTVLLVADEGGSLVGFTHLFPSFTSVGAQRLWILNDLFVAPDARRRGVAEALMQAAEAHGRATGAVRLVLQTATDNAPAQALYRRLGWTVDDGFVTFEKVLPASGAFGTVGA